MSLIMHIKKDFGSFKLSVDLETTSLVNALLGASGSGKTMTLKCLAGIEKPDEGIIILNGKVLFDSKKKINLPPQKRKVGYLFQNYALFPDMSVKNNIMCGMIKSISHEEKEKRLSRYHEYIKLLSLEGLEHHKPYQLSGGQQQRVALARILVSEPDILLLDEPFSALDEHLRSTLEVEFINLIRKFGKDTIIVTHNKEEAYLLSDSIASISNGEIVIYKNAKELFLKPEYVESAILAGCKNYSKIQKIDDQTISLTDWGIKIPMTIMNESFVGVKNDGFAMEGDIKYSIQIVNVFEEPDNLLVIFRFQNQVEGTPSIFWRPSKNMKDTLKNVKEVAIKYDSILLLKSH